MENIAIYDNKDFVELVASEGYVITTYKEGDDKITYGKKIAVPTKDDVKEYHAMPEAEAEKLAKEFDEKRKAEREAKRAERKKQTEEKTEE